MTNQEEMSVYEDESKMAEAVRAYMARHGIKLAAFARHAGIPYPTLDAVMRATRAPSARTIERMTAAMQSDPASRQPKHAASRPYRGEPFALTPFVLC